MTRRRPTILGILFVVVLSLFLTAPLYARPSEEGDCRLCHTGNGITISSNATGTLRANASGFFYIQVMAEGNGDFLTIKWPSSLNPSFTFLPSMVTDGGPNDHDPSANKVNATFTINAPASSGEYSIRVLAADAADAAFNGASLGFQVQVTRTGSIGPGFGNVSPIAFFLYNRLGMTVEFEDRSWDPDGNITSRHWSFGDNVNLTEQNPAHTFAEAGTYTTTLTVTDNKGDSNTYSHTFTLPPKNERLMLWGVQILIGSLIIVFTSVFAVGIVSARFKRGGKNG